MSREHVSRTKYDTLRDKAERWREKAADYEKRYEDILVENEQLIVENEELQESRFSDADIARYGELEEDVRQLNKDIAENARREAALQEENTMLSADVQKYKYQYKEERKKIRDLEKENQLKSMMNDIISQRLPKSNASSEQH